MVVRVEAGEHDLPFPRGSTGGVEGRVEDDAETGALRRIVVCVLKEGADLDPALPALVTVGDTDYDVGDAGSSAHRYTVSRT